MSKENIAKIFSEAKRKIKLKHGKFLGLGVGGKAIYEKETLKEKMLKAGYPYCYRIKGVDRHCETCIKNYKKKKT